MPEMGESVTEGTVLEWHMAEGQEVEEGETVVEVSTDKVDAEVPGAGERRDHEAHGRGRRHVEVGQALARDRPERHGLRQRGVGRPGAARRADGSVTGGGEGDADLGEDDVQRRVGGTGRPREARCRG